MWMIIIILIVFIVLMGFTGNIVSLLRQIKASNEKIIQLLEHQNRKNKHLTHLAGGVCHR
ncbi:hypothetical protein [Bacillus safensis]|uniref:hypothetical protein n=1 Tax=Bacillus safensis TaxID=561879 RepID=UPI001933E9FF|nr:hypothetical protein [Bacillus safensis]QRF31043.1 hypothetical protein JNE45_11990 [Bacillus safensis]